jgi:hypothetical protein
MEPTPATSAGAAEPAHAPLTSAAAAGAADAPPAAASAPRAHRASAHVVLVPPTPLPNEMEFSVHEPPRTLRRDLASVFPSVDVSRVVAVPTAQRAAVELVAWGPVADGEKDLLLERFVAWAAAVCDALAAAGHWADYVDPCSGLPVRTRNCTVRGRQGRGARGARVVSPAPTPPPPSPHAHTPHPLPPPPRRWCSLRWTPSRRCCGGAPPPRAAAR